MRFAGQVAVVTGGALGIGGGISRRLAAAGAHVVLADVNSGAAAATCDEIRAAGGRCTAVVGDIRDRDVVAAVTETGLAVHDSRIDILVNNVGDFRPAARDFLHSTEEQWQTLYELNLLHVLRMCHSVLPAMVSRGSGAIVNNAPSTSPNTESASTRSPQIWPTPRRRPPNSCCGVATPS
jgi:2-hydroxycyclohexanecarboxyl-CoA dehydrogenase